MRRVLACAVLLFAGGCAHPAPPSAPVVLPILRRPVAILHEHAPWLPRRAPSPVSAGITIPRAALTALGGLPGVFVLNRRDRARFRLVRVGRIGSVSVQILSGLSGSETLVLGDLRDVHDGSLIVPQTP